jgi:ABC-type Na+ efflux pump permease subunit
VGVTTDAAAADAQLLNHQIDVVLVAPADVEQRFRAGQQSPIEVRVNVVDPVEQNYTTFLARALEREVNRIIVERIAQEGQSYALGAGAQEAAQIPPDVVAAPTVAEVENIAPSQPTVVQYFGAAVLALILQHMALTLIALSITRERTTGLFELFHVSPITAIELIFGKLIAFGLFAGAIAVVTLLLLIGAIRRCSPPSLGC